MKQGQNDLNFKSRNVNTALPNCPRYNKEMSPACVLSLQHADIYSMLALEVARLDISLTKILRGSIKTILHNYPSLI